MTSLFSEVRTTPKLRLPVQLIPAHERSVSALDFFSQDRSSSLNASFEQAEVVVEVQSADAVAQRMQEVSAMIDAARREALDQAQRGFEEELSSRLQHERARVDRLCGQFSTDRERYFGAAEVQVVRLALAIAEKVLWRELEVDTMSLAGTVLAALRNCREDTKTVLKVRISEADAWRALLAEQPDVQVQVVGDDHLRAGDCVLETRLGRIELGVKSQLQEIQRNFNGLMERGDVQAGE